jgi:hypothetical protein
MVVHMKHICSTARKYEESWVITWLCAWHTTHWPWTVAGQWSSSFAPHCVFSFLKKVLEDHRFVFDAYVKAAMMQCRCHDDSLISAERCVWQIDGLNRPIRCSSSLSCCKEHLRLHSFQIINRIQHFRTKLCGTSIVPTSQIFVPTMLILMTSIKVRWSPIAWSLLAHQFHKNLLINVSQVAQSV